MKLHDLLGNCWHPSVAFDEAERLVDVCLEHDEPRGDCSECPRCPACDEEIARLLTERDAPCKDDQP